MSAPKHGPATEIIVLADGAGGALVCERPCAASARAPSRRPAPARPKSPIGALWRAAVRRLALRGPPPST